MNYKSLLLGILFFHFSLSFLAAQDAFFEWANHAEGSGGLAKTNSITCDSIGNIYSTGEYVGERDFDPGSNNLMFKSSGFDRGIIQPDIFIQKMDKDGKLLWALSLGEEGWDTGLNIELDQFGHIYVSGYSRSPRLDLDPGPDSTFIENAREDRVPFLLKLDSGGNFIWGFSPTNSGRIGTYQDFIIDDSSKLIFVGAYSGTVDFDPDTTKFELSAQGSRDIFILKLDQNGKFVWVKTLRSSFSGIGGAIKQDHQGNLIIAGSLQGKMDLDPGTDTLFFETWNINDADPFILKLDSSGDLIWALVTPGFNMATILELAIDASDNIYAAVNRRLNKYDSSGNLLSTLGVNASVNAVVIDSAENVYTTGSYQFNVDFDPDSATKLLIGRGEDDAFVAKYTRDFEYIWAKGIGSRGFDYGLAIALDHRQEVISGGTFSRIVDFDPNSGVFELNPDGMSGGGIANYIWKLREAWPVGINDPELNGLIEIYPNPAKDYLVYKINDPSIKPIEIFDIQGKPIGIKVGNGSTIKLDHLAKGVYFIQFQRKGQFTFKKIVKN